MAFGRAAIAALAAVVTVGAAAVARPGTYDYYYPSASRTVKNDEKLCYDDGERAIGAPGYPRVPYFPCCSGKPPLPMDTKAKSYSAKDDWGLFCGGTGKVAVDKKNCYGDKERAIGAPGKPYVPYKPCCDGREPRSKFDDWGKFCGFDAPEAPKPTVPEKKIPTKCAGEEGYPYVPYVDCGKGMKCAREPKYGWGFFCMPIDKSCYGPGVKGQGAPGYPAITYLPCCDGQEQVKKAGDWGKFCPGKKDPVYEAPKPDYYKPVDAPRDFKPSPPPKGYVPPTYEPADPVYPTYPTVKPPKVTKPPKTTTVAVPKNPLTAEFGNNFGCRTSGPAAVVDPEFTIAPAAESVVQIELPECDGGYLTQADANALLNRLCDIARTFDGDVQCRIDTVPASARMLLAEDDNLDVVSRQLFIVIFIFGWSFIFEFSLFALAVAAAFPGIVTVFVILLPGGTPAA